MEAPRPNMDLNPRNESGSHHREGDSQMQRMDGSLSQAS
jgi:hypothetical protein